MLNTAVQSKGFPLAGLLTNANPQNLKKPEAESSSLSSIVMVQGLVKLSLNLTKPHFCSDGMMTNDDISSAQQTARLLANVSVQVVAKRSLNLSKPDIQSAESLAENLTKPNIQNAVAGGTQGFIAVTTRGGRVFRTSLRVVMDFGTSTRTRSRFSVAIKKGGIINPTLYLDDKVIFSALDYSGSLDLRRWRRFISPFAAVIRKPAVLSPSSFSFSISSKSSRGSRTESCKERLFFLPVAITETSCFRWCSVYTAKLIIKHLKWCSPSYTLVVFTLSTVKTQKVHKTAKPRGALTPSGLLTTTDRACIEVAMSNRTTPHMGRASLSPNKFIWRFLALSSIDRNVMHITATTEREAREQSPAGCVMVFAGRLPVLEVPHG